MRHFPPPSEPHTRAGQASLILELRPDVAYNTYIPFYTKTLSTPLKLCTINRG